MLPNNFLGYFKVMRLSSVSSNISTEDDEDDEPTESRDDFLLFLVLDFLVVVERSATSLLFPCFL